MRHLIKIHDETDPEAVLLEGSGAPQIVDTRKQEQANMYVALQECKLMLSRDHMT